MTSLSERIAAARASGDWPLHADLWEQRRMAEVDADEALLRPAEDLTEEGIQLVIPGAERVQPASQKQGELF